MDKSKIFHPTHLNKYLSRGFVVEKHKSEDLFIYGYNSNFNIVWDTVNVNLRGLITDGQGVIIARSFSKFFNFKAYLSSTKFLLSDGQIADIPSGRFKIFEKIDGCLVMLYWSQNKPYLATQRSFASKKALKATQILHEKYAHTFGNFDKSKTYIFEAVFPETNVIIDYGNIEDLFLIGIIDVETGANLPLENIGFKLPHEYTEDFSLVNDLRVLQGMNIFNKEGFIILYENGFRLKVKFSWYNSVHNLFSKIKKLQEDLYTEVKKLKLLKNVEENMLSNRHIYNLLNEGKPVEFLYKNLPAAHYFRGVEHWVEDVCRDYEKKKMDQLDQGKNGEIVSHVNLMPDEEIFFDIDRTVEIHYKDSIMWNFMNRIKELYD